MKFMFYVCVCGWFRSAAFMSIKFISKSNQFRLFYSNRCMTCKNSERFVFYRRHFCLVFIVRRFFINVPFCHNYDIKKFRSKFLAITNCIVSHIVDTLSVFIYLLMTRFYPEEFGFFFGYQLLTSIISCRSEVLCINRVMQQCIRVYQ